MIHQSCPTVFSPECFVSYLYPVLQSFKDHLRLPLAGIAASARSYGDSDAASSLRSGPGGKPSSLWSFLRGPGRCAAVKGCILHTATYCMLPTCAVLWSVYCNVDTLACFMSPACATCVPGCPAWVWSRLPRDGMCAAAVWRLY